ncbi:MAG: hypothetical protein WCF90_11150 [Methanomicrobiales archaeon]
MQDRTCPSYRAALDSCTNPDEFEPGVQEDLRRVFVVQAPDNATSAYNTPGGDGNGRPPVRVSQVGP